MRALGVYGIYGLTAIICPSWVSFESRSRSALLADKTADLETFVAVFGSPAKLSHCHRSICVRTCARLVMVPGLDEIACSAGFP